MEIHGTIYRHLLQTSVYTIDVWDSKTKCDNQPIAIEYFQKQFIGKLADGDR